MGGVVDAIGDAIGDVVDFAGDAVEWVGDTVSNVVQAAIDDPLKTVVQVAAVSTGNAWALPYIEGIDTLEEGGSLEDALVNGVKTYVVQQGVGAVMDSFGTAPGVDVNGTTQFFDDGSSIQFFDDGSTLATDASGAVSSSPATDFITPAAGDATGFTPSGGVETLSIPDPNAAVPPPGGEVGPLLSEAGTEVFPVAPPGPVDISEIAGVPVAALSPPPVETLPVQDLFSQTVNLPGQEGNIYRFDDGSTLQMFDDGSTMATDIDGNPTFSPGTDVVTPGYVDPNAPGFGEQGTAEVIDRSVRSEDLPPGTDRPITDVITDIVKEGGSTIYDYVTENPITTIVGGATIAGALDTEKTPEKPPEPEKKTYTYQPAAQIGSTRGLQELWSAAQSIYGDKLTEMIGITPNQMPQGSATTSPLLGGPAPGGIGSLRTTFAPGAQAPTFDVNTLTPEQIVRLQGLLERRRGEMI